VAEQVTQSPDFAPLVPVVLEGICFAFATRVSPNIPRSDRRWRRLTRFISHDFLLRSVDRDAGRAIYSRLESVLNWDFHYWLQRGAFELELFNMEAATQFLDQARSLRPDDRYVEVEYGYLLMRKASRMVGSGEAADELFREGFALLQDVIVRHGQQMPHPYDIMARQTLAWMEAAQLSRADARPLLETVARLLEDGVRHHPGQRDLATLLERVKQTWLERAVFDR
jgi:hypothetical protein